MGRPVRTAAAGLAVASTIGLGAALPATAPVALAAPTQSQTVFTQKLLDDPATSAGIKRLLRSRQAIVSPTSGFVDVTGDRRQDAVILVTTGGAAGAVGLYVFSTHGQTSSDATSLRVVFRLQTLDDASLRLSGTTLSVLEPKWAKGDDLCCPARLRERDYAFDARALTFRRTADRTTPFATTS
jgi:hypothetical protein